MSKELLRDCGCGNSYLAIRTDIYKDKREFIYCDCCGALATRPLWQSAHQPIAQPVQPENDALPRDEFAALVVQEACETEPADTDDLDCIKILTRNLHSAVLSAFLRNDVSSTRPEPIAQPVQPDELTRAQDVAEVVDVRDALCRIELFATYIRKTLDHPDYSSKNVPRLNDGPLYNACERAIFIQMEVKKLLADSRVTAPAQPAQPNPEIYVPDTMDFACVAQPVQPTSAFPYQQTFDAICAGARIEGGSLAVSVRAFKESWNATGGKPVQPGQEPVAWYEHNPSLDAWFLAYNKNPNPQIKTRPLIFGDTSPPQREWVGLTDEEATKLWDSTDDRDSWELLKRVEAKLKEKNT